jgi:hypothetical protein
MDAIDKDRMLAFRGDDLSDAEGEKIGKVVEMYLDADSGEPEWALVHTGLFGSKQTFVPLRGATEEDGGLRVPHTKKQVGDAPHFDPAGQLTKDQESELYRHYGVERDDRDTDGDEAAGDTGGD